MNCSYIAINYTISVTNNEKRKFVTKFFFFLLNNGFLILIQVFVLGYKRYNDIFSMLMGITRKLLFLKHE